MIDATTARALERIEARVDDVGHQFDPGYIPVLVDDRRTSSPRSTPSLDPLHATAPQDAYYVTADALGRRAYSRDGAFRLCDGALQAPDGSAVLGYLAGATAADAPQALRVDPVDAALGRASDARIEADGTLAYSRKTIDPKSKAAHTERVVVGRVALARFPAGTRVDAADGVHVTAPAGVAPILGTPKSDAFASLVTHSDDRGGIDIERGLSRLRDAFLSFSALQSAHNAHGRTDKVAMDLIK